MMHFSFFGILKMQVYHLQINETLFIISVYEELLKHIHHSSPECLCCMLNFSLSIFVSTRCKSFTFKTSFCTEQKWLETRGLE